MSQSQLVTFEKDIFPYVKGEIRKLEADELKRIDAVAKRLGLDKVYQQGAKDVVEAVNDGREASVKLAQAARSAAVANNVDQAAVLEAQRQAVAEPANVDALGIAPETPASVVTGTKPVAGVTVDNAQQATNIGDPAGANVVSDGKASDSSSAGNSKSSTAAKS